MIPLVIPRVIQKSRWDSKFEFLPHDGIVSATLRSLPAGFQEGGEIVPKRRNES